MVKKKRQLGEQLAFYWKTRFPASQSPFPFSWTQAFYWICKVHTNSVSFFLNSVYTDARGFWEQPWTQVHGWMQMQCACRNCTTIPLSPTICSALHIVPDSVWGNKVSCRCPQLLSYPGNSPLKQKRHILGIPWDSIACLDTVFVPRAN